MARHYIIGMDEAGYGPKLGPLVIAATLWSVQESSFASFDFWKELDPIATNSPRRGDHRLHVADSKEVYSPGKGLKSLERSVLGFTSLAGYQAGSLKEFIQQIGQSVPSSFEKQPWYQNRDLELPLACDKALISRDGLQLKQFLKPMELKLETIAVEIVCPERFNHLIEQFGNKSELLTKCSLKLLKHIRPAKDVPTQIWADKHGGRNRYLEHLLEAFPDQFFIAEQESQQESRYREGATSICFGVKSERHFPVALASMVAKYVRETCMEMFNHFWRTHLPDLKPTKGYPQDAKRFRAEIEHLIPQICPDENILWRNR